jgi:hypothetical protein
MIAGYRKMVTGQVSLINFNQFQLYVKISSIILKFRPHAVKIDASLKYPEVQPTWVLTSTPREKEGRVTNEENVWCREEKIKLA